MLLLPMIRRFGESVMVCALRSYTHNACGGATSLTSELADGAASSGGRKSRTERHRRHRKGDRVPMGVGGWVGLGGGGQRSERRRRRR